MLSPRPVGYGLNPLQQEEEEDGLQFVDVLKQLAGGFVQGFTTIDIVEEDPDHWLESLAQGVGYFAGFVGIIPGVGTAVSFGTKAGVRTTAAGLKLLGKTVGKETTEAVMTKGMEGIRNVTQPVVQKYYTQTRSLPFYAADLIMDMGKKALAGTPAEALAKKVLMGPNGKRVIVEDIAKSAMRMGLASGVSSWQGGIDQMMYSFGTGAVFGAADKGVANMLGSLKDSKSVRAMAGMMVNGLPSTLMDQPLEIQIFDYLTGAWFGTEMPYAQRKAMEAMTNPAIMSSGQKRYEAWLNPEENIPEYKNAKELYGDQAENVQKEIVHQSRMWLGSSVGSAKSGIVPQIVAHAWFKDKYDQLVPYYKENKNMTDEQAHEAAMDAIRKSPITVAMAKTAEELDLRIKSGEFDVDEFTGEIDVSAVNSALNEGIKAKTANSDKSKRTALDNMETGLTAKEEVVDPITETNNQVENLVEQDPESVVSEEGSINMESLYSMADIAPADPVGGDVESKKADIEKRRQESLNDVRELTFNNGTQWEGFYDTGKEGRISGTNMPSGRKLVEKVLSFTKQETIDRINAKYDREIRDIKPVKKSVSDIFDANSDLSSIGTKEQYSEYLDTIFPDSQVKDIVYHGTNKNIEGDFIPNEGSGSSFATSKEYASRYGENIYPAILNLKNPETTYGLPVFTKGVMDASKTLNQTLFENGYDGVFSSETIGGLSTEAIVTKPDQIHILGSKKDVEGFNSFVKSKQQELKKAQEPEPIISINKTIEQPKLVPTPSSQIDPTKPIATDVVPIQPEPIRTITKDAVESTDTGKIDDSALVDGSVNRILEDGYTGDVNQLYLNRVSPVNYVARTIVSSDNTILAKDKETRYSEIVEGIRTDYNSFMADGTATPYDFAIATIEKYGSKAKIDDKSRNELVSTITQASRKMSLNVKTSQVIVDINNKTIRESSDKSSNGTPISVSKAKSHVERRLAETYNSNVQVIRLVERGDSDGNYDDPTNVFDAYEDPKDMMWIHHQMLQNGKAFMGHVKSNGELVYYDMIPATPDEMISIQSQIKELGLENTYLNARQEYVDDVKKKMDINDDEAKALYDQYVASQVKLITEVLNPGITLSDIAKKGFVNDFVAFNKRMQLIHGEGQWADDRYFRDVEGAETGFKFVILSSSNKNGLTKRDGFDDDVFNIDDNGNIIEVKSETATDGAVIVRSDVFDQMVKDGGFDPESGVIKSIIAGNDNEGLGMLLSKHAMFRAGSAQDEFMKTNGLHMVLRDTSAKQPGKRKIYDSQLGADNVFRIYDRGTTNETNIQDAVQTLPINAISYNLSTKESISSSLEKQVLVSQLLGNLHNSKVDDAFMSDIFEDTNGKAIRGDEKAIQAFEKRIVEIEKASNDNQASLIASKIDVDNLGIQQIIDVLFYKKGGNHVYNKVIRHILKSNIKEDPNSYIAETEFKGKDLSASEKIILSIPENEIISDALISNRNLVKYVGNKIRSYISNRIDSPQVEYSAKAIGLPTDEFNRGLVREGEFMLGQGSRAMKVKSRSEDRDMTLGELWDLYQAKIKENTDGSLNQKVKDLEKDLRMVVVRVPADSISGARSLAFKGFYDNRGTGIALHSTDMSYMGGMDLDIDSTFIYQDLGKNTYGKSKKTLHDVLLENKDQWSKVVGGKEKKWSRFSQNNYEVSSAGDDRFSALKAKLKDGRTIEEAWQLDIKGYRSKGNNPMLGKGKKPLVKMTKEESWNAYKGLWKQWAVENPDLINDLVQKSEGKVLTDKFASSENNQARALAEIINEQQPQQSTRVLIESKNDEGAIDMGVKPVPKNYKNIASLFDMKALTTVGLNATKGKLAVGSAASARTDISSWYSVAPDVLRMPVPEKLKLPKGVDYGDVVALESVKKDNIREFDASARQAMNYAADSSDTFDMIRPTQISNMLWGKAFDTYAVLKNGKRVKIDQNVKPDAYKSYKQAIDSTQTHKYTDQGVRKPKHLYEFLYSFRGIEKASDFKSKKALEASRLNIPDPDIFSMAGFSGLGAKGYSKLIKSYRDYYTEKGVSQVTGIIDTQRRQRIEILQSLAHYKSINSDKTVLAIQEEVSGYMIKISKSKDPEEIANLREKIANKIDYAQQLISQDISDVVTSMLLMRQAEDLVKKVKDDPKKKEQVLRAINDIATKADSFKKAYTTVSSESANNQGKNKGEAIDGLQADIANFRNNVLQSEWQRKLFDTYMLGTFNVQRSSDIAKQEMMYKNRDMLSPEEEAYFGKLTASVYANNLNSFGAFIKATGFDNVRDFYKAYSDIAQKLLDPKSLNKNTFMWMYQKVGGDSTDVSKVDISNIDDLLRIGKDDSLSSVTPDRALSSSTDKNDIAMDEQTIMELNQIGKEKDQDLYRDCLDK